MSSKTIHIAVDVEANGPLPGINSMISLGAVVVEFGLDRHYYCTVRPVSKDYVPEALRVSKFTFAQTQGFEDPVAVMPKFKQWLLSLGGKPVMWSDNPAFDWQFVNYYLLRYAGGNPFGHSARRIGDLYCGLKRDLGANREWKKKLRLTKHTHNALDDAAANASALLQMFEMIREDA